MPKITEIIENVRSLFGRRTLSSGDIKALREDEREVNSMITSQMNQFDEKIKVEGVKTTVDKENQMPKYKRLDEETKREINVFFHGITQDDFYKYKEITENEGISSSGEPFQCFMELDDSGNIIVTPEKMISIKEKDKDNGEYSETRQQKDGTYAIAKFKKVHGDIVGCEFLKAKSNDAKLIEKLEKFCEVYRDPNLIRKLEMKGMSENEKIVYTNVLKSLGIKNHKFTAPENLTKEEYINSKETGNMRSVCRDNMYSVEDGFKTVGCSFKDGEDKPEEIWQLTAREGEEAKSKSFKRTPEGKYFDTSSFKMIDGKPQFRLLEYEDVVKIVGEDSIRQNTKTRDKMKKDLKNDFPKEAKQINDHATKQRAMNKDDIDNPFPSFPTYR